MGHHPFLNILPGDFTTGTGREVWCDRGMTLGQIYMGTKALAWCIDSNGIENQQFVKDPYTKWCLKMVKSTF